MPISNSGLSFNFWAIDNRGWFLLTPAFRGLIPKRPFRTPLKDTRYLFEVRPKEDGMTAAAGFVYKDGIVICADTLITGGIVSRHVSKLGGYRFNDGVAIFSIAGNVGMAEAAIQQCEEALVDYTGSPRRRTQIAKVIRTALCTEYKTHIIENRYERSEYDYAVIVALHSQVDGLGLYYTCSSQMARSKEGCEFIGSGESLALLALQRLGGPRALKIADAKRASVIAAYALGEAKRHQQGAVGGESIILHIEKDGMVSTAHGCNELLTEKYAAEFHKRTDSLLSLFLNLDSEQIVQQTLKEYPEEIANLRRRYRDEVGSTFYLGPTETSSVVWEINSPEYLEKRRLRRAAQ